MIRIWKKNVSLYRFNDSPEKDNFKWDNGMMKIVLEKETANFYWENNIFLKIVTLTDPNRLGLYTSDYK